MPHLVKCHLCLTEMSMSDDIFARRIAGRKVSLKCRHCTSTIIVDATGGNTAVLQSTSRHEAPAVGAKATSTPVAKAPVPPPAEAAKPPSATAVTTKLRAIAPVASPPRRETPFGGIPAVAPVASPPRRNTPFGGMPAVVPSVVQAVGPAAAPARRHTPFGGIPAQAPPRQAPPRVVTPPPFPAVTPAVKSDDVEEVSVAELLPAEPTVAPPKAALVPASAPADDVQEVSVVDLLPEGPPPIPARRAAMETLPDTSQPPQPVAAPAAGMTLPAAVGVVPAAAALEPREVPLPAAEPPVVGPVVTSVALEPARTTPEPAASPFAQTVAYGPDSDLTPRAFGFQDPAPAAEAPPRPAEPEQLSAQPARGFRKRAAVAAVAFLGVAAAAVAVVRSGALDRAASQAELPSVKGPIEKPVAAAAPPLAPAATAPTPTAPAPTAPAATAPAAIAPAPSPAPEPTAAAAAPAAPSAPAAATAPSTANDGTGALPAYVSEPGVRFLTRVAVQRAERTCHRRGRAVGKAQVFATFMPNGRVSQARVEGEPIESAPVSRCIKDQLYAVVIPKFTGASFTVSEPITLY
jgi:hypothetical protein